MTEPVDIPLRDRLGGLLTTSLAWCVLEDLNDVAALETRMPLKTERYNPSPGKLLGL